VKASLSVCLKKSLMQKSSSLRVRRIANLTNLMGAVRAAGRKGELRLLHVVESLYDLRFNIRSRSDDLRPAFRDDEGYDPISYPALEYIRKRVGFLSGEVFVDIGCGRGRAVCVFSRLPTVARCVGIEYHSGHARIARQNAAKVRARIASIDIINADASAQDYDGTTFIFMYNPFGEATMRQTMQCIEESLRRNPRVLRILYVNPKYDNVLEEQPWLTKVESLQIPNRIHRSLPASLWRSTLGARCDDTAPQSRS
jgi:predicted RNA methylase